MTLTLLVAALLVPSLGAQNTRPQQREEVRFSGRLEARQRFERRFGPDFVFEIVPDRSEPGEPFDGWTMHVRRVGEQEDLSGFTTPLYGPRQMYLSAWYFLPDANAPKRERFLKFSPEAGRTVTWEMFRGSEEARTAASAGLGRIAAFGHVDLTVTDLSISGDTPDNAVFNWVAFRAVISWPASYTAGALRE